MASIKINDSEFEWQEQGNGIPVLFVHGSVNDYRAWENQIERFSEKYHAISYSRRFHYPNTYNVDRIDYKISHHVDDLQALIKSLNLGPVNLVGSSYGAYVSLLVALKDSNLVKTLVLGEPPILPLLISNPDNPLQMLSLLLRDFSTGKSFLRFGMKSINPAKEAFRKGNLQEGVHLFVKGVIGEEEFEKLPAEAMAVFMDNGPALQAELLAPRFPSFPEEAAKWLNIPTLLAYGEQSPQFFHAISDKLLKILPRREKVIIPDASHDIHEDNPDVYNEIVLDFLDRYN